MGRFLQQLNFIPVGNALVRTGNALERTLSEFTIAFSTSAPRANEAYDVMLLSLLFLLSSMALVVQAATWCVARSDASDQALQTALDYVCGAGADCSPIAANGLCYLPNTIQAHASYAYNSYFQRKGMAPGSCDFAGTAIMAKSEPSYGSCVYPSSLSAAGGMSTTSTTPTTTTTIPTYGYGNTGLNPVTNPPMTTDNSEAPSGYLAIVGLIPVVLLLVISFILQPPVLNT